MLAYASPRPARRRQGVVKDRRRRGVVRSTCALLFAAFGAMLVLSGLGELELYPGRASRFIACGVLLIVPGLWYGFAGLAYAVIAKTRGR